MLHCQRRAATNKITRGVVVAAAAAAAASLFVVLYLYYEADDALTVIDSNKNKARLKWEIVFIPLLFI